MSFQAIEVAAAVVLLFVYVAVNYGAYVGQAFTWLLSKWQSGSPVAPPTAAKITAEQASSATFVLARYIASQKDTPEYKAVCASIKTLVESAA